MWERAETLVVGQATGRGIDVANKRRWAMNIGIGIEVRWSEDGGASHGDMLENRAIG
jgi:hypothetical protein